MNTFKMHKFVNCKTNYVELSIFPPKNAHFRKMQQNPQNGSLHCPSPTVWISRKFANSLRSAAWRDTCLRRGVATRTDAGAAAASVAFLTLHPCLALGTRIHPFRVLKSVLVLIFYYWCERWCNAEKSSVGALNFHDQLYPNSNYFQGFFINS